MHRRSGKSLIILACVSREAMDRWRLDIGRWGPRMSLSAEYCGTVARSAQRLYRRKGRTALGLNCQYGSTAQRVCCVYCLVDGNKGRAFPKIYLFCPSFRTICPSKLSTRSPRAARERGRFETSSWLPPAFKVVAQLEFAGCASVAKKSPSPSGT